MTKQILIIEDDIAFGKMLTTFLERKGYDVDACTTGAKAKELMEAGSYDLIITDLKLPDTNGLDVLDLQRELSPASETIMMTGYADVTTAVEAIKKGALDYISKPFRPEELVMVINQAFSKKPIHISPIAASDASIETNANGSGKVTPGKTDFITGISEISRRIHDHLKLVGPTDMCVLLHGESGTGKEVAARAIHDQSARRDHEFVAVDCGAIPKEVAPSEFFGHVKGSFTGAITDKKGHFEAAQKGTLFLDEVGNLPYENQIQLLRALQERKIKPVGSTKEIGVDVRIISATNEDLKKAVAKGTFREDLYHRLNEFSVHLPALRDRKEDLFLFTEYFLDEANRALDKNVLGFSNEVEGAFKRYNWPGNLRELKNVIMRSVLLTNDKSISLDAIPKEVLTYTEELPMTDFSTESNEKQLILSALKQANNNKSEAAKLLNISRKTLYNKLERYQLEH